MIIQVLLSRKTVKANEKKGLLVLIRRTISQNAVVLQSFDRFRLGSVIEQKPIEANRTFDYSQLLIKKWFEPVFNLA